MPVYEYQCRDCGRSFEELVRSEREERAVACPSCGARRPEKQLSVFAAQKGEPRRPLPQRGCGRCGDPNGPCSIG